MALTEYDVHRDCVQQVTCRADRGIEVLHTYTMAIEASPTTLYADNTSSIVGLRSEGGDAYLSNV